MRVISSFVLAVWVASGVVAPCMAAVCAGAERAHCCCGGAADCHCRLTAHSVPVQTAALTPAKVAPDQASLPVSERSDRVDDSVRLPVSGPRVDASAATDLPLYIATHAFRC